MKRRTVPYYMILLSILTGWTSGIVIAQTPFDEEFRDEASQISEQVRVFADRSIYAVDEDIHFVADYSAKGPIGDQTWSSILYVELIAPTGKPMVQGKFHISDGEAAGTLHIPGESITGVYVLKCYTRWMRNSGPASFSYTALKIINPFRPEVAVPENDINPAGSFKPVAGGRGVLECVTGSNLYHKGEEVVLQVTGSASYTPDRIRFSVTVVPSGAIDLPGEYFEPASSAGETAFTVGFLPDLTNGVTLSGTVVGPDQQPVPYATLHFSLLGKNPDFFATMSDENGRFVITTPAGSKETMEFFITPEQEEGRGLEVRIDQEFDTRQVPIPWEQFRLSDDEIELAGKIALNMQLSKAYRPEASRLGEVAEDTVGSRVPFYGTRVKRLLIDDYIMLPNLEEVFINLIPEVQFYKKQGKDRIRFISLNKSIDVYNPLIMMDQISIFDHEALLALNPEKIERIDLINDIYLKGNVAFGGVLAIYSRKGDMAGIDLPKGSYFFDYQSIHQEAPSVGPISYGEGRIPDIRNTIFWAPDLQLEKGTQMEVPFKAPAGQGDYIVLLRGVTAGGEIFSASTSFRVE
jgi:hypothetical protein